MARAQGRRQALDEVVAVDIGSRFTKALHVRCKGEALTVVNYSLVKRPDGSQAWGMTEMADHLRSVVKQLKTGCKNIALTLRHEDAVLIHADLPQTAPADLRKMIKLSPKSYVGQDLPDHVFDCFFRSTAKPSDTTSRRKRKSRVLVAGARRRIVEDALDIARLAGLHLVGLIPAPVALANAFRLTRDDSHPDAVALLDLGASHSTINIVGHGEVLLSRVVALGSEKFADVLSPDVGAEDSGAEEVSPEVMQARLQKAILTFAREVDASVGFYTSQFERHISQLFVSGGTARSQLVLQMLESELTYSCEGWNLQRYLTTELPDQRLRELEYELPQLVIAVGCAAGLLQTGAISIDLLAERQEAAEARRRDPVRRLAMAGGAVVGLTVLWTAWLGWQYWHLRGQVANSAAKEEIIRKRSQSEESLESDRNARAIYVLHSHATNRVLYGPILNALQFVNATNIQVQQLRLERMKRREEIKPLPEIGGLSTFVYYETVVMDLVLRNYGDHPHYEAWEKSILAQSFFRDNLRTNSPVMVLNRSQYQPDSMEPERGEYALYTVRCLFPERRL
jgi:Tfp pilus assembly PilM family ATPase